MRCQQITGDLTPWAKETLTQRLKSLTLVESSEMTCVVTKAANFDGDVTVSQRKGKRIYFYDLSIELEFKGACVRACARLCSRGGNAARRRLFFQILVRTARSRKRCACESKSNDQSNCRRFERRFVE